jgi:hypothetical protein
MQGKSQPEARSAQVPVYVGVGVDVCKDHLDVYLHPLGRRLRVANHRDSIRRLERELAEESFTVVAGERAAPPGYCPGTSTVEPSVR